MKPNQLQLAKCLVAELEVFAEAELDVDGIENSWLSGMLHRGIPFTPSYWSGGQNPRRKMRLVRAADQLEQLGLLKRLTEPKRDRATHVIPSAELIAAAVDRLGNQVDVVAVVAGLSRTYWGRGIANRLTQIRASTASVGHCDRSNKHNQQLTQRTIQPSLIASTARPSPPQQIRRLDARKSQISLAHARRAFDRSRGTAGRRNHCPKRPRPTLGDFSRESF